MRHATKLTDDDQELGLRIAGSAWSDLRDARLLVTGGTGFVGRNLIDLLLAANRVHSLNLAVIVLTRSPTAAIAAMPHWREDPTLNLVEGDVTSPLPDLGHFSHVVHGAALFGDKARQEPSASTMATIIDGTRHMLAAAQQGGARRGLLLSSGAVYGRQPPESPRIAESHLGGPDPLSLDATYAESKRLAEHLCRLVSTERKLEIPVARLFAFVGPHLPLDEHYAVGNFIRDGLEGGPIRIQGDGTPIRSYLYSVELAAWLIVLLTRGRAGVAYNVGGNEPTSIADLASIVADCFTPRPHVEIALKVHRDEKPDRYVPDLSRAEIDLGLRPSLSLKESIAKTVSWHQEATSRPTVGRGES